MAEKNTIIKCGECGKAINHYIYKGRNNTYLCGGDWMKGRGVCGSHVCFKCGKVENRTEWGKGEDCCGNEIMVERKKDMFSQTEKDENDPNRELHVYYCDEHMEEAKKSPLLWTKTDSDRLIKQEEQKKQEIEEKLNSRPGLFYCKEPFPRSVEGKQIKGIEYGCVYFWGQENGQNFFLMVPDTHPVLNDLKYKEKLKSEKDGREIEYTRYNLKEQFYLIEGIDKLSLEDTNNRYEGSDPYKKAYKFNKFVGLTDKITITPADNHGKPEKNNPVENKPTDNSNSQPKKLDNNTLLQYFQKNNINSIKLEGEILIIERNDNWTSAKPLIGFPELKGIDEYLQSKNDKTVSRQELESSNNSDTASTTKPHDNNNALWISCGIGGTLIITVIIGLLLKRRKNRIKKH